MAIGNPDNSWDVRFRNEELFLQEAVYFVRTGKIKQM